MGYFGVKEIDWSRFSSSSPSEICAALVRLSSAAAVDVAAAVAAVAAAAGYVAVAAAAVAADDKIVDVFNQDQEY